MHMYGSVGPKLDPFEFHPLASSSTNEGLLSGYVAVFRGRYTCGIPSIVYEHVDREGIIQCIKGKGDAQRNGYKAVKFQKEHCQVLR